MERWITRIIVIGTVLGLGFGYEHIAKLMGFSKTQIAAADVLRQRLGESIQQLIGKGDITIQEYSHEIQEMKDKLIRIKVARKTYEQKLQSRQQELQETTMGEKRNLIKTEMQDFESFLAKLKQAESDLEIALKKMNDNLETVKRKVSMLQTQVEILRIQADIRDYTQEQMEIQSSNTLLEQATKDLTKQIYTLQAQQEVEHILQHIK